MSLDDLVDILMRIDGKSYKNYKRLLGIRFTINGCTAFFTKIQSDPYAPPSVLEIKIPYKKHRINELRTPVLDFISRIMFSVSRKYSSKRGTGNSGYIGIPRPSPCILYRSSAEARGSTLILRTYIGLPARGRRILGKIAAKMLREYLPVILEEICGLKNKYKTLLERHIEVYDDYYFLRKWLRENSFISFIANGSILPRRSSRSDKPLPGATPFMVSDAFAEEIELPSGKIVKGLAIQSGVTIITGGGFHGKTTLLNSIIEGIYPHIPGDGREYVVTLPEAVYVKAEDGRIINGVDISIFINNLPSPTNTRRFRTLNASGSTSMAASISEALEAGMNIVLFDEDTAATNLLYKDKFMDDIIPEEPITPLTSLCKSMKNTGISIIGVMSASSSMIPCSDKIIVMRRYKPYVLMTQHIRIEPSFYPTKNIDFKKPLVRKICLHGSSALKLRARHDRIILKSKEQNYDLLIDNPRIVEKGQINYAVKIIAKLIREKTCRDVPSLIRYIDEIIKSGFNKISKILTPDLTYLYPFDVLWIINRLPLPWKPS